MVCVVYLIVMFGEEGSAKSIIIIVVTQNAPEEQPPAFLVYNCRILIIGLTIVKSGDNRVLRLSSSHYCLSLQNSLFPKVIQDSSSD
jgi:hypothetical protein